MHGPTSGFVEKYFGSFKFKHHNSVLEIQTSTGSTLGRYTILSAAPSPCGFLQWFLTRVGKKERPGSRGSWHVHDYGPGKLAPVSGFDGDDGGGGDVRLLLTTLAISSTTSLVSDRETRWGHVQAIGQLSRDASVDYQHGLLCLERAAHEVFASQPTRRFLHGFYMRGPLAELYVFDRSGVYCSEVFDLEKDAVRFLGYVLSYHWMTDEELGDLNTEMDGGGS